MLRVGVGLSAERDSERAAEEAASAALRSGGLTNADLLLVFATTPHGPGFTRVSRTAGAIAGARDVVGCSAAGVLAHEEEVEEGPAVAIMALGGDFSARRFFVPGLRGRAAAVADEIADAIGTLAPPTAGTEQLLFLFADSYNLDAEPLLRGLARRLPGVRVVGGGASEDGSVGETSVFTADAVSSNAVAGALIAGRFRVRVEVGQAVRRVGPVHRVTASTGNMVFGLDDHPAYEVFSRLVPAPLLADPRRAASVVLAGIGSGEGEFAVRHLIGLDPSRGAVAVAEPMAEGQELFFAIRDPEAARENLQEVLAREADAWRSAPPAGALYVNCVGRGRRFYGHPGLDTAYISRHLGPLPVAGFFSGAEIGSRSGAARLHQYTGILTLLGPGS
jgi:small ligand-binding sensory domain FIST